MASEPICSICGQPDEDHHVFEPIVPPAGCVCPVYCWGHPPAIPAICGEYVLDEATGEERLCKTCEHKEACHGGE